MRRLLQVLLTGALMAPFSFGQAARYDNFAWTVTQSGASANPAVAVVPNATVTVCSFPAVGSPCTNKATIYTDQTLVTPAANPFQADQFGNFGFWAPSGTYQYTITVGGVTVGPFSVTLGFSGGTVPNATTFQAGTKGPLTVDATTFGVVADGTTDNSTALQAAINAAISTNRILQLPAGTMLYSTTLNFNSGVNGVSVRGGTFQPNITSGFSILKYTGTGDAILVSNGTTFVFGENWENFIVMAGANATNAVNGNNVSEGTFRRIGIWSDGTHKFTNGWAGAGWNICFWDGWIVQQVTNAVKFTSSVQSPASALFFRNGDTFQVTNVFNLTGQFDHISDVEGWHETQNIGVLIDDTTVQTSGFGLYLNNTRFLFNGATGTYPDQLLTKINNVSGKVMALHQINFDHVTAFMSSGIPNYPISIALANGSSIASLLAGGGSSFIGANTGLITTSTVSGSQVNFLGTGFESLNASLAPLGTLIGGSGGQAVDIETTGINVNNSAVIIDTTGKVTAGNGFTMGGPFIIGATGRLLFHNTAPTVSSGFGTSPSIVTNNGTAAFTVNVGTGGTATSGVIGLPTAGTGWNCSATDITTPGANFTKQSATTTTSATLTNYNSAGTATAWTASDIVQVSCFAR